MAIKPSTVLKVAADLIGSDPEDVDPEYSRAIVEMVIDLVGGSSDDKDVVLQFLVALAT